MECILYHRWDETVSVADPANAKLPKGYGYILIWFRNSRGLSQSDLARELREGDESETALLSTIKKIETDKQQLPIWLLERIRRKYQLRQKWWEHVPPDVARGFLQAAETRRPYPSIRLPSVRLPLAPKDRSAALRSLFVIDRAMFNRFREYPGWFVIPGFQPYVTDDVGAHFPILFADEVYPEDPDVDGDNIAVGDEFAVRTDIVPHSGDMVAATGKNGERYRRLLVMVEGHKVLRHFTLKAPDIAVRDVAAIEGIICGRMRRFPEIQGGKASFAPRGLTVDHL